MAIPEEVLAQMREDRQIRMALQQAERPLPETATVEQMQAQERGVKRLRARRKELIKFIAEEGEAEATRETEERLVSEERAAGFAEGVAGREERRVEREQAPVIDVGGPPGFEPIFDEALGVVRMPTPEERAAAGNMLQSMIPPAAMELIGVFALAGVLSLALNIGRGKSVKPVR
jgi:hypothetical protein